MGAHLLHRLQGVPATEARQNAAVGLYSVGVDVLVGEGIAAVDLEALQHLLVDIDEQLERMLKIGREYVGPDQTLVCGVMRMCIIHRNVPAMLANITALLSRDGVNVENLSNKSKGEMAYTMVDLAAAVDQRVIADVENLANVIRVRIV